MSLKLISEPLPPHRSKNLAEWLELESAIDFRRVVETLIAEDALLLTDNHCSNAEEFLSNSATSEEYREAQRRMARYSICLKVFSEIGELALKKSDKGRPSFEVMSAIKLQ
jgi:hypothetical protein